MRHPFVVHPALRGGMTPDFQLFEAIQRGDIIDSIKAVELGASVHAKDLSGRTVLEMAADSGLNQLIPWLVKLGADPRQSCGVQGQSLLHKAVITENFGFAAAILEHGVYVDVTNQAGQTPLFLAARGGLDFMADRFIQAGANINSYEPRTGNTALHVAAINGDSSMIKLLLKRGANPSITNKTSYTALHEAASAGHTEAVNLLLDRTCPTSHERRSLLPRVRRAAERNGHTKLSALLQAAEQSPSGSFAERSQLGIDDLASSR
jgi:ankyrin repeat protein